MEKHGLGQLVMPSLRESWIGDPKSRFGVEAVSPYAEAILGEALACLDREAPYLTAVREAAPPPEMIVRSRAFAWVAAHRDELTALHQVDRETRVALLRAAAADADAPAELQDAGLGGGLLARALYLLLIESNALEPGDLQGWLEHPLNLEQLGLVVAAGGVVDPETRARLLGELDYYAGGLGHLYLLQRALRDDCPGAAALLPARPWFGGDGCTLAIVEVLRGETGRDLGFDLDAWRAWLETEKMGDRRER
jgi:hypothetical protein